MTTEELTRDEMIEQYGYASTVSREAIMRLLDDVTTDDKLDKKETLIYWKIMRDWTTKIVDELEQE